MIQTFFKSKIHRATVTDAELSYEGSIAIDENLLKAANIAEYEQVDVLNINNGERFTTYAVKAKKGSGIINIMGAAARKAQIGDLVIILTYCGLTEKEIKTHKPKVVLVDAKNRIKNK